MIEPQFVYTTSEVLEELNISKHNHANFIRRLQRLGRKHNIEKVDNNYIFDGKTILDYLKSITNDNVVQSSLYVVKDVVKPSLDIKEKANQTTQQTTQRPTSSNVVPEEIKRMQEQIKALYESNKVLNNTISLLNDEIEKLKEQSIAKQIDDTTRQFGWIKKD
jgi:predicted RNase H-like nuclease (RuvC/YqgF family)